MSNTPKIQSFTHVVPMIYAYNTPGVTYHDGWTKIGYTEKQSVSQRLNQQTHTAGIKWVLAWQDNAMYKTGIFTHFWSRIWMWNGHPERNGFMWMQRHLRIISIPFPDGKG